MPSSRVTLKAIHEALQSLGHDIRLEKGDGYFYFWSGEANGWLDRTVNVPTLNSLSLEQWLDAFNQLRKLNQEFLSPRPGATKATPPRPKRTKRTL